MLYFSVKGSLKGKALMVLYTVFNGEYQGIIRLH